MNDTISLESLSGSDCFHPYNNSWVRPKTPAEQDRKTPRRDQM